MLVGVQELTQLTPDVVYERGGAVQFSQCCTPTNEGFTNDAPVATWSGDSVPLASNDGVVRSGLVVAKSRRVASG